MVREVSAFKVDFNLNSAQIGIGEWEVTGGPMGLGLIDSECFYELF